ncbi:hypothetical protein QMK33_11045 [Hymenobacter sp. H14-R3]|uniref:hypothetical protein n=1 Tax=Hymenobacter sp. H14-R3 TaxID=3046308 RepID=UPI0024B97D29|nr:hypothetical protein [Hymenobacter sp. H14-R3]MDJ0365689.1 hypothetical protein [Hymenobacter sp. H14-R3]
MQNLVRLLAPGRWLSLPGGVWLVLLLVHGLAATHALRTGHYCFPDSGRYVQAAQNMGQRGQLYAQPWPAGLPTGRAVQEFSIRPPGYPALLWLLGAPVGVLLLQNMLSIVGLAAVLSGWAARRARPPGLGAWLAALGLVLSFPAQFIYANALMSELPLQAVLLLGVGLAGGFARTGRLGYLVGVAALLVAAWLLKPVCAPFTVVFLAMASWLAWRRHRPALLLVGGLPLLLALSYMGWNWQRTGYLHFSSISTINLLHYNAAGVLRQAQGPAAEEAWVAQTLRVANAQPSFGARQASIETAAVAMLRRYPLRYAGQHLLGMITFFIDPGRFDMSVFWGKNQSAGLLAALRGQGVAGVVRGLAGQSMPLVTLLLITLLANALRLVLALRGLLRPATPSAAGRADWLRIGAPAGRWLAAALLGYLALLTGPLGAARFLVPGWPLLLALALHGLPQLAAPTPPPTPAQP